jgi:hypothetical protein
MKKREKTAFVEHMRARTEGLKATRRKVDIITLNPNGKNRGFLIPFGDLHWGAKTCNQQKIINMIKYAYDNKIPMLGMGDWMECGLSDSVGDSVYMQTRNPQGQVDDLVELFTPLAKAGLITGIHSGNHEDRLSDRVGLDITKNIAQLLGVRRYGYGQLHKVKVGKQTYTMYTTHGSSGARTPYTKIKSAMDIFRYVNTEIVMMGHVHALDTHTGKMLSIDMRNSTMVQLKRYAVLTGHYLEYEGSYAQKKNMIPSKTGSPKVIFQGNEHKVNVSI